VKAFSDSTEVSDFERILPSEKYSIVLFLCEECTLGEITDDTERAASASKIAILKDDFDFLSKSYSEIFFATIFPTENFRIADQYNYYKLAEEKNLKPYGPNFVIFRKNGSGEVQVISTTGGLLQRSVLEEFIKKNTN
jgi:hypothetical protein